MAAVLLLLTAAEVSAADDRIAEIQQGLSVENALWGECPLGDYIADAVRVGTGARIALIPSDLLRGDLVGDGAVTEEELAELLAVDTDVVIYTLTAPHLKTLLEDSVSHWSLSENETLDGEASAYGGFFQVSGLTVRADASAAPGQRVLSVKVAGENLDLSDETVTITAAIPETQVPDAPSKQTGRTVLALLRDYMQAQGTVALTERDRIQVIGAHAREIASWIPVWAVGVVAVVIGANAVLTKTRKEETEHRPW